MKIAIVHDYLNQYGGAEKVVEVFHEIFPEAPIFTTIYDYNKFPEYYDDFDIRTTFMQSFPFLDRHFKKYLLFYPKAIESIDLSEYDVVLSSSSAFAKGAIKDKNAIHICYCHAPMRFAWDYERYIEKEDFGKIIRKILPPVVRHLKKWDLKTIGRVDYYIANSEYIQNRIQKFYNRESFVINPPIDTMKFNYTEKIEDYFLIVSRLNAYKNIDLPIKVFNKMKLKLKIVGSGPYKEVLENLSCKDNIEFLGRLNDTELREAYSRCRAFIFPGKEDFGITSIEAQASGRPVIALGKAGALETVKEGRTGIFFNNSVKSLESAIERFIEMEDSFDRERIKKNALKYDKKIFIEKMRKFIFDKYNENKFNIR